LLSPPHTIFLDSSSTDINVAIHLEAHEQQRFQTVVKQLPTGLFKVQRTKIFVVKTIIPASSEVQRTETIHAN
jgi:hypothetical protein